MAGLLTYSVGIEDRARLRIIRVDERSVIDDCNVCIKNIGTAIDFGILNLGLAIVLVVADRFLFAALA